MTELKIGYPDITFAAQSIASSATYDTDFPVKNIVNGPLSAHAKLQTAIAGQHTIEWDLGEGNEKSADYFALLRARPLKQSLTDQIVLRGSDVSYLNWQALSWTAIWDFSQGYTVDSVNRISQINDLSGNANHATQGTEANQPILSRADNKENLILQSQNPADSAYAASGPVGITSVTVSAEVDSGGGVYALVTCDAGAGYHFHYQNQIPSGGINTVITFSAEVKKGNYQYLWIGDAFASWHGVAVDLDSGTLGTQTNLNSASIETLSNGGYRVTITYPKSASTNTSPVIAFHSGLTGSAPTSGTVFAGTETFYTSRWQQTIATSEADYLETTDYRQYAGINGNRAAVFDGSDDYLSADSAASPFSGDDKPFTCFIVGQLRVLKNYHTWLTLNSTSSTNPYHDLYAGASNWGSYRAQDSGAASSLLGGTCDTSLTVLSFVFTGTTLSAWDNQVQFFTASAHDVGTATFDRLWMGALKAGGSAATDYLNGKLAFAAIIPGALDDTNREAVEDYLINRYQTTPIVNIDNVSTLSLTGQNADHYIEYFTESTAFRYWALQFNSSEETKGSEGAHV